MPSLNCFLLPGGTASAGAHDVKEVSEEGYLDVADSTFLCFLVIPLSTYCECNHNLGSRPRLAQKNRGRGATRAQTMESRKLWPELRLSAIIYYDR